MSAYSDWKCGALTDEEFKSAMERECKDWPPDGEVEHIYTCQDCEFCKMYQKAFVHEIVTREVDGQPVLRKTKNYRYIDLCIRDIDNIKEVNSYDDVCDEHGELYREDM